MDPQNLVNCVQGICTLVIAAASLDDVLAISLFTLLLGMVFNTGHSLTRLLLQAQLSETIQPDTTAESLPPLGQ
jgi:hypothetical protein